MATGGVSSERDLSKRLLAYCREQVDIIGNVNPGEWYEGADIGWEMGKRGSTQQLAYANDNYAIEVHMPEGYNIIDKKTNRSIFQTQLNNAPIPLNVQTILFGLIETLPNFRKTFDDFVHYQSLARAPQVFAAAPAPAPGGVQPVAALPNLQNLLKAPVIPPLVQDYAKKGIESYKLGGAMHGVLASYRKQRILVGGRANGNWIENTFGENEHDIVEKFKKIPPPPTFTIGEIAQAAGAANVGAQKPNFHIVQGVGANYLQDGPSGKNAIVQLASQADFNEATRAEDQPVLGWIYDYTQGPQCAIEAAAGAMHRKAAKQNNPNMHALEFLLPANLVKIEGFYQHGYLDLTKLNDAQKEQFLAHLEKNIDKLKILPHWVQCEVSGAYQLQVCAFAPSFQSKNPYVESEPPEEGSPDDKICRLLVVPQYKAIAELAVIRARETGERVPLHLTLVGQGVFANRPEVMREAMKAVADTVRGANVEVFVHAFKNTDIEKIKTQMDTIKGSVSYKTMTSDQFFTYSHPAAFNAAAHNAPAYIVAAPAIPSASSPCPPGSSVEKKTTLPLEDKLAPPIPGAKQGAPYLAKDHKEATENCKKFIQERGFQECVEVVDDTKDDRGYAFCFNTEQAAKRFAEAIADPKQFSGSNKITNAQGGKKEPYKRPDGTYSISIDRPYNNVNGVAQGNILSQLESLRNFDPSPKSRLRPKK